MYDVPIFKERKKRIAKCNKDYRCFIGRSKSSTSSTGCFILKTLKVNALSSEMVNKLFVFWLHAAFNAKMFWEIVLYFDDLESFIVCTIFLKNSTNNETEIQQWGQKCYGHLLSIFKWNTLYRTTVEHYTFLLPSSA